MIRFDSKTYYSSETQIIKSYRLMASAKIRTLVFHACSVGHAFVRFLEIPMVNLKNTFWERRYTNGDHARMLHLPVGIDLTKKAGNTHPKTLKMLRKIDL